MKGTVSHELDVALPASEVWAVYRSLELGQLVVKLLPNVIDKLDIIEGDGGVGTVLHLTFPSGTTGPQYYREKFVKIDDVKRLKEAIVIEGGYLDLGFTSYFVRFEIIEKESGSSIIRSTIEYEINDELAANASYVTTGPLATIAVAIAKYLLENKATV